jgi:hypothetical protein
MMKQTYRGSVQPCSASAQGSQVQWRHLHHRHTSRLLARNAGRDGFTSQPLTTGQWLLGHSATADNHALTRPNANTAAYAKCRFGAPGVVRIVLIALLCALGQVSVGIAQGVDASVAIVQVPPSPTVGIAGSYVLQVTAPGGTGVTTTTILSPKVTFNGGAGCTGVSAPGDPSTTVICAWTGSNISMSVTPLSSGPLKMVAGVIANQADPLMTNNSAIQSLTVGTSGPGALFLSQQAPPRTMPQSLTVPVSVAMQNSGSSAWTLAQGYRLGSQNPDNNTRWGLSRVDLGSGESITTGQNKTFLFNATAPATPGIYPFQWRMLQEGVVWFGDITPNSPVDVGGKRLYALTPCRVLDTRNANGPYGGPAIPAFGSRTFAIGGQCAVALTARAVAINVAVVTPGATGEFRIAPSDATGQVSVVAFTAGITRAANTTAPLSLTSPGSLTIINGTGIATNVVVDVYGYFQ